MSSNEVPFFAQSAFIDRYAHSADAMSDPELLNVLIEALRANPSLNECFFRSGPDPAWAPVLLEQGFLAAPPPPIPTDRGEMLPRWEAQEFLIRVAGTVPDVVTEHIRTIKAHAVYLEKAIKALRGIPLEKARTVLPIVIEWLRDPQISRYIALQSLELMTQFAEAGMSGSAFNLFRELTNPLPSTDHRTYGNIIWGGAAKSILPIDSYHLRDFRKGIASLQKLDIEQTVSGLEEQLCAALRIEGQTRNETDYKERSFWRKAIEETSQDQVREYKDLLLTALRDTLEKWVQENSSIAIPLAERYLNSSYEILRRVGLHLLWRFPTVFNSLVARELLRPENLDDVGIHHEYFMLLEHGYQHITHIEQESLIASITGGPSPEKLERVADWGQKELGADRDNYLKTYVKIWTRDRLWMLRTHIGGHTKDILDELLSEFGTPEHPAFTSWTSGIYTVSDISPLAEEEIARKTPAELIEYLKTWQRDEKKEFGPLRESYGALGRDVAQYVLSNLENYNHLIKEIALIRPQYATSFLYASPEQELAPLTLWELRLSLCEHLLSDEHIRTDKGSPKERGWRSFRSSAVELLKKAITDKESKLPEEFLPRVRDLLLVLVDAPDPDLESDRPQEGRIGHEDTITVAINRTGSEALAALIEYSRRIAIREMDREKSDLTSERLDPLVKDVLTRKVNFRNEPSLAVHSVFGRELNLLYWLDKQWVETHIDEIFPAGEDQECLSYYVAAWDSYVVSSPTVYLEIYHFLRDKYERAIENVSKGYVTKTHLDPVKSLASHLLLEYLLSTYDIESPEGQESLIAKFFNRTSSESRAEASSALSDLVIERKDEIAKYWQRSRSLWAWRVNVASNSNHSTEFDQEMRSLSRLLYAAPSTETIISLWPLLEGMLTYIGRSEDWDYIWHSFQEYLSKEVGRDPVRVIQFYGLMHDQLALAKSYYEPEARTILEAAAADKNSRQAALMLIDRIARRGNYEFRDIQEQYLK